MNNWDSNSAQSKGMSNRNDVTGDKLQTKIPSQEYKDNYDAIFRKPKLTTIEVIAKYLDDMEPDSIQWTKTLTVQGVKYAVSNVYKSEYNPSSDNHRVIQFVTLTSDTWLYNLYRTRYEFDHHVEEWSKFVPVESDEQQGEQE